MDLRAKSLTNILNKNCRNIFLEFLQNSLTILCYFYIICWADRSIGNIQLKLRLRTELFDVTWKFTSCYATVSWIFSLYFCKNLLEFVSICAENFSTFCVHFTTFLRDNIFFKASTLWAHAFYKSICPSVCVFVCSLLRYRLNVLCPHFLKSVVQ